MPLWIGIVCLQGNVVRPCPWVPMQHRGAVLRVRAVAPMVPAELVLQR